MIELLLQMGALAMEGSDKVTYGVGTQCATSIVDLDCLDNTATARLWRALPSQHTIPPRHIQQ